MEYVRALYFWLHVYESAKHFYLTLFKQIHMVL
jgi:hypothetical protein